MAQSSIIYFDIAAVVVTGVCLASLIVRHKTRGPVNRVYLSYIVLVLATALSAVAGEVIDELIATSFIDASGGSGPNIVSLRSGFKLLYYVLRCETAAAFLVLISAVSDTSHFLNRGTLTRVLLWTPMIAATLFVLANPIHHLVFTVVDGYAQRGPCIFVVYGVSVYYSLIGVGWLIRWRQTLDRETFSMLMSMYPIVFSSVIAQYYVPTLRIEMFVTSVVLMLLSAFVLRPELQRDSLADAASLHAYREMCQRAFATKKRLCLVYLEIVNMERLRELVGMDELQDIVRMMSVNLSRSLERGDVLYYLRNGLFCISSHSVDAAHALRIAQEMHAQGKSKAMEQAKATGAQSIGAEMRSCVIRIPEDMSDINVLRNFVRRFGHLVPTSTVTTYAELTKQEDFELQMALSDVVARAIRNRSFDVYYQPIHCCKDGHFHTAEALVRLHDPDFGWISPALFIPEAEQNGAILSIGNILLEKIFEFLGEVDYEATSLDYVEVNLSVDQCVRPHLAHMLLGFAQEHHVSPARVNLEITETSSTFSRAVIENNVRVLAEAGFSFSLDDYGTGYSSVTRALDLPFSLIKFDKCFVDGIANNDMLTVLERSIDMMHSVGKEVLIEGVETRAQATLVKKMGADYIQGFHFARPLPKQEFIEFLATQNVS